MRTKTRRENGTDELLLIRDLSKIVPSPESRMSTSSSHWSLDTWVAIAKAP
ncbi:MAG: hypothetical protein JOZ31_24720 [Verrucomicrobia bacterium]|nr:hypothetical protein [Verrucomicrobiota bacterium]MBV8484554.1 hypothetical protein [Verrucomicrobiota bacterium]